MPTACTSLGITIGLAVVVPFLSTGCSSRPIDRLTPVFGEPDLLVERFRG